MLRPAHRDEYPDAAVRAPVEGLLAEVDDTEPAASDALRLARRGLAAAEQADERERQVTLYRKARRAYLSYRWEYRRSRAELSYRLVVLAARAAIDAGDVDPDGGIGYLVGHLSQDDSVTAVLKDGAGLFEPTDEVRSRAAVMAKGSDIGAADDIVAAKLLRGGYTREVDLQVVDQEQLSRVLERIELGHIDRELVPRYERDPTPRERMDRLEELLGLATEEESEVPSEDDLEISVSADVSIDESADVSVDVDLDDHDGL
jgi:hypothetical protein